MMNKTWQIIANLVLYVFLLWLLYDSTIKEWDPWFAFVVAFVLLLAIIISLIPALHAPKVSPGSYPFED
ncbi:MAG: hypothetical protein AB1714_25880 [Acidobacteriota bacterium]